MNNSEKHVDTIRFKAGLDYDGFRIFSKDEHIVVTSEAKLNYYDVAKLRNFLTDWMNNYRKVKGHAKTK